MSELLQKINDATTRVAELQKERADTEKEANALEAQARAKRVRMVELKQELAQLDAVLRHSQVAKGVQDVHAEAVQAREAAQASQAESAETLKRLAEKEKALDELIAKHAKAPADVADATKP